MLRFFIFSLLAVSSLYGQGTEALLRLNGLFRDDMVLQQQSDATVWGKTAPGAQVMVEGSWGKKATAKADKEGAWKAVIETPKAGGPFKLEVRSAGKVLTLKNVMSGEVWICGGQSNMQWRMRGFGTKHFAEDLAKADYPDVRYCYLPQVMALDPQEEVACSWTVCTPRSASGFSAVGYFFGSKLYDELKVPIGLIATNWGGSSAEAWVNPDVLGKKFPEFNETLGEYEKHRNKFVGSFPKEKKLPKVMKQTSPAILYNSMIHPLIPYRIKGVIWYQGESNVNEPLQYRTLFPALIQNWRAEWGQGDFPFYFVQIAPYSPKREKLSSAFLREAQTYALKEPNTGMVVTMDLGDPTNVHPKNKKPVGVRLANLALKHNYGREDLVASGPRYADYKIRGKVATIAFEELGGGLTTRDGEGPSHFTMAGEDQKFHPAIAEIKGKVIVVTCDKVAEPVSVRFAWRSGDEPNLMNKEGLPVSSFRLDEWEMRGR